jgi:hypothetical protein
MLLSGHFTTSFQIIILFQTRLVVVKLLAGITAVCDTKHGMIIFLGGGSGNMVKACH